jgi:hypothetical protein
MKKFIVAFFVCGLVSYSALAQKKNNTDITQYLQKGDSLRKAEKKGEQARLMYRKVISLDSENAVAYHKIAESFVSDYSNEGIDTYLDSVIMYENKSRIIDPKFKDAYAGEVAAYRAKWRHGMTRKVLLEAIQHLPNDPEILMLIGRNR